MTTCSIVMPVHNRAALTRQCLDTLLASPAQTTETEIVVVDDGSSDSTPELLSSYGDRIRVVRHDRNAGFATACNDGAGASSGEWIVFLNNDTLPQPGWLDALLGYASGRERIGFVAAKLVYPNGRIQHAGVVVGRDRRLHHLYAGFPADHPATNTSREFQVVTSACVLVPRAAFEEAGGFDTAFFNAYEDVDLCLRFRRLGYENHYCHESVVVHLETMTRDLGIDLENFELYLERWADVVVQDDFRYYAEDGLIDMRYWKQFPALLSVSPLLAVLDERADETDRLLAQRGRELVEALEENTRLKAELLEAQARIGRGL